MRPACNARFVPRAPWRALALVAAVVAAAVPAFAPPAAAEGNGNGSVLAFGSAPFLGAPEADTLRHPLVGMTATASGKGYWLVASDGGVFAYGDAAFLGSTGSLTLKKPIVGMASTADGYWLVASDGGIFSFGVPFVGSTGGIALNQPVVGMAATPSGKGYWMVARDGGIFTFGDAAFLGSMGGTKLNQPVVAMAATPSGKGYWLVAADGGMFAFGDAGFYGSAASQALPSPVGAIAATPTGAGYFLVTADGTVLAYGDAKADGSGTGSLAAGTQVVAMALHPGGGYWLAAGRPVLVLGALGPGVRALQQRLLDLHFWGPVDGSYGSLTTQQVYAFQKANGLPRDGTLDGTELGLLEKAQPVVPRSTSGRVVEVDKTRQILIVSVNGITQWVFNTSTGSGKTYAPGKVAVTPEGHFRFERQIDGTRVSDLGVLFRPKYFVDGYAVHGSTSVPPFPASHGCVRVTNAAINFIWDTNVIPLGTEAFVYS
ncbi:MAG TPA: L,D-transpeptidase family protein [Acidimicrobiales bacterium]|nr:L,D-transpeptidase family protein [Acidimicrobiales bacterium]